ncbi:hypothetical protein EVAR_65732_1 [Eumeta japonica]|uniref:Uncharacterized protein n=1 Tax=Eumeta variegata TaxID=151549 RepID=A0A4C1ZZ98_EUMVA|nr:hypothetical protein EVAR_65732_1 [Eumeta japonica]
MRNFHLYGECAHTQRNRSLVPNAPGARCQELHECDSAYVDGEQQSRARADVRNDKTLRVQRRRSALMCFPLPPQRQCALAAFK